MTDEETLPQASAHESPGQGLGAILNTTSRKDTGDTPSHGISATSKQNLLILGERAKLRTSQPRTAS